MFAQVLRVKEVLACVARCSAQNKETMLKNVVIISFLRIFIEIKFVSVVRINIDSHTCMDVKYK